MQHIELMHPSTRHSVIYYYGVINAQSITLEDLPQLHTPTAVSPCLLDYYNTHKTEHISLPITYNRGYCGTVQPRLSEPPWPAPKSKCLDKQKSSDNRGFG